MAIVVLPSRLTLLFTSSKSDLKWLKATFLRWVGVIDVRYNANSVQLNLTIGIDLSTSFLKPFMCQIDWFKLYHYYGCGRAGLMVKVLVEIKKNKIQKYCGSKKMGPLTP